MGRISREECVHFYGLGRAGMGTVTSFSDEQPATEHVALSLLRKGGTESLRVR
jgi:hypothetical protein